MIYVPAVRGQHMSGAETDRKVLPPHSPSATSRLEPSDRSNVNLLEASKPEGRDTVSTRKSNLMEHGEHHENRNEILTIHALLPS